MSLDRGVFCKRWCFPTFIVPVDSLVCALMVRCVLSVNGAGAHFSVSGTKRGHGTLGRDCVHAWCGARSHLVATYAPAPLAHLVPYSFFGTCWHGALHNHYSSRRAMMIAASIRRCRGNAYPVVRSVLWGGVFFVLGYFCWRAPPSTSVCITALSVDDYPRHTLAVLLLHWFSVFSLCYLLPVDHSPLGRYTA